MRKDYRQTTSSFNIPCTTIAYLPKESYKLQETFADILIMNTLQEHISKCLNPLQLPDPHRIIYFSATRTKYADLPMVLIMSFVNLNSNVDNRNCFGAPSELLCMLRFKIQYVSYYTIFFHSQRHSSFSKLKLAHFFHMLGSEIQVYEAQIRIPTH